MTDLTRMSYRPRPESVMVVGTGGVARQRRAYVNGTASDDPVMRNNAAVLRVSGLAVSIDGTGMDGADVSTNTPIEEVTAGTIFRAEGEVEVSVRADARPGFNGGAPRGVLAVSIFIERLVPVGSASDLLRAQPQRKSGATE